MRQAITEFKQHTDNINEIISASHVNEVHTAVNELENNVRENIRRTLFSEAFKVFENIEKNCMNVLSDIEKYNIELTQSYGVEVVDHYDLVLENEVDKGVYVSQPITSFVSESSLLSEVSLLLIGQHEDYMECGVLTKNGDYYPFDAQGNSTLKEPVTSFQLKVTLTRMPTGESPVVQLLSAYYNDAEISKDLLLY